MTFSCLRAIYHEVSFHWFSFHIVDPGRLKLFCQLRVILEELVQLHRVGRAHFVDLLSTSNRQNHINPVFVPYLTFYEWGTYLLILLSFSYYTHIIKGVVWCALEKKEYLRPWRDIAQISTRKPAAAPTRLRFEPFTLFSWLAGYRLFQCLRHFFLKLQICMKSRKQN